MSDDDFSMNGGGSKSSSTAPGKHRGPRFTWNAQYEATFFHSLCESVQLGLREGSTFKPEAWDRAIQALIEKHNAYANKGHLINKSDNARKKYRLWRGLREDPLFYYNPATRMVTATDDSWARHLQKEPLARSLKGRPFDHEEFYEILFPDVIGSGGAPKRLTKPRRKGPDNVNGAEDQDAPSTSLLDMLTDTSFLPPAPTNHMAQSVQHSVHQAPVSASMSTTAPSPAQQQQQQQLHRQPQPSVVMAPPPSRSSVTPTTSALTPPEENSSQQQGRKRPNVPEGNPSLKSPEKRRRTAPPTYIDLQQPGQSHVGGVANTSSSNGGGSNNNNIDAAAKAKASSNANAAAVPTPAGTPTTSPLTASAVTDSILAIAEALRKTKPAWQEQAMDIFFRDFPNEDPDLQIKIAEKALTDENKAMFFCKMPEPLRKHWVKRLREVHNRVV